jgi:hypothetical protein
MMNEVMRKSKGPMGIGGREGDYLMLLVAIKLIS